MRGLLRMTFLCVAYVVLIYALVFCLAAFAYRTTREIPPKRTHVYITNVITEYQTNVVSYNITNYFTKVEAENPDLILNENITNEVYAAFPEMAHDFESLTREQKWSIMFSNMPSIPE
jgi:hypothetical protein